MLLGLREKKREQGKTEDIRRAMEQWQEAERYFKSVSDTDLVGLRGFRDGGCEKEIHAAPQALCRGA